MTSTAAHKPWYVGAPTSERPHDVDPYSACQSLVKHSAGPRTFGTWFDCARFPDKQGQAAVEDLCRNCHFNFCGTAADIRALEDFEDQIQEMYYGHTGADAFADDEEED